MLKWSKTPRRQKNPSNQLVSDASASLDDDSSLKFDVTVSQNANMPQQTTPEIVIENESCLAEARRKFGTENMTMETLYPPISPDPDNCSIASSTSFAQTGRASNCSTLDRPGAKSKKSFLLNNKNII